MTNASIRDVCVVWRKGLRRTRDLPHNTHCNCFHCCVMCCHLWTSWAVRAQNLLRTHLIETAMLLQDMAFILLSRIGRNTYFCCPRYGVSLYTLHILLKILFVAMFGVLSLLMLFLLCGVRCLLELFYVRHEYSSLSLLRVMSLCMLFVIVNWLDVHCALFLSNQIKFITKIQIPMKEAKQKVMCQQDTKAAKSCTNRCPNRKN